MYLLWQLLGRFRDYKSMADPQKCSQKEGLSCSILKNQKLKLLRFPKTKDMANLWLNRAVFMGANTYIGNAPNFMVKSIADENGVRMPSFFGYLLWSLGILVPVFALDMLLFFLSQDCLQEEL